MAFIQLTDENGEKFFGNIDHLMRLYVDKKGKTRIVGWRHNKHVEVKETYDYVSEKIDEILKEEKDQDRKHDPIRNSAAILCENKNIDDFFGIATDLDGILTDVIRELNESKGCMTTKNAHVLYRHLLWAAKYHVQEGIKEIMGSLEYPQKTVKKEEKSNEVLRLKVTELLVGISSSDAIEILRDVSSHIKENSIVTKMNPSYERSIGVLIGDGSVL